MGPQHYKPFWLYFVAFAVIIVGLIVYFWSSTREFCLRVTSGGFDADTPLQPNHRERLNHERPPTFSRGANGPLLRIKYKRKLWGVCRNVILGFLPVFVPLWLFSWLNG